MFVLLPFPFVGTYSNPSFILLQSIYLLTLASYLEERAARIRREALGRAQVALAGSKPNCFHYILDSFFGYKGDNASETESTVGENLEAPSPRDGRNWLPKDSSFQTPTDSSAGQAPISAVQVLPPKKRPQQIKDFSTLGGLHSGSESESGRTYASPGATKAVIFKPGPVEKTWSRTGIPKEFLPVHDAGKYSCPACQNFEPKSNIDTVATHIRRNHLNVALGCHFCDQVFFSSEGWKKHNVSVHNLPKAQFVPLDAEDPGVYQPLKGVQSVEEINEEEEAAIREATGLKDQNLDIEPGFVSMDITE